MNKKQEIDFDQVSINVILNPALRFVKLANKTCQTEYIINYEDKRYLPLFEVDEEEKLTGDCMIFKLHVNETEPEKLKLEPIVTDKEWTLALSLYDYVEANTEIVKKQLERQQEQ